LYISDKSRTDIYFYNKQIKEEIEEIKGGGGKERERKERDHNI
jgi:hypothetical protein